MATSLSPVSWDLPGVLYCFLSYKDAGLKTRHLQVVLERLLFGDLWGHVILNEYSLDMLSIVIVYHDESEEIAKAFAMEVAKVTYFKEQFVTLAKGD